MTTTHKTVIVGRCPHGCHDVYEAEFTIVGESVVTVESIQESIDRLTAEPVYQEDLTRRLAAAVGCRVRTVGTHGRFLTTCEAEGQTDSIDQSASAGSR
jgi:hypothetical protein